MDAFEEYLVHVWNLQYSDKRNLSPAWPVTHLDPMIGALLSRKIINFLGQAKKDNAIMTIKNRNINSSLKLWIKNDDNLSKLLAIKGDDFVFSDSLSEARREMLFRFFMSCNPVSVFR